ncbi:carboxypeptidase-like regulatory domain-containing protein [Pontibacter chitinilyticus]|uniref:carboxypeptidase-like regulatory domain-containing protein n=1 Tax=Pontibacter chitinilyticus TaxID=2674989 RepID=UPI00321B613F
MPHVKQRILWDGGDHPSTELLRQYHSATASPALQHQLEHHLLDCELCTDVLEGLTLADLTRTKAAIAAINRQVAAQVQQRKKQQLVPVWQVAAAILLLVCSAAGVVYYNFNQLAPAPETMAVDAKIKQSTDLSAPVISAAPAAVSSTDPIKTDSAAPLAAVTAKVKPISPVIKPDEEIITTQDEITGGKALAEIAESHPLIQNDQISPDSVPVATSSADLLNQRSLADKTVPESIAISRTLQGRVAGVSIRGGRSLQADVAEGKYKTITGKVLSPEGEPLPGVAVVLDGTAAGTVTDSAGAYALQVPAGEQTLRFNYIGYVSAEKKLNQNARSADVRLQPDIRALEEVVVTGYGSTRQQQEVPVVVPARPIMGTRKYKKYLEQHRQAVPGKGKVVVQFTVGTDGRLQDFHIQKSLCPACDAEALRLVKEGPAWKAATSNDQPLTQQAQVSVHFK